MSRLTDPGRPSVKVFGLGGTIASMPTVSGDRAVPELSAAQLIESVPALDAVADIEGETVLTKASGDLTFSDIVAVARRLEAEKEHFDGFVLTQGTDTLEETAFLLSILVPDLQVAITGAMRNPGLSGPDGPANLLAAVNTAAAREAGLLGPVVVMADEIHLPRYVQKTHTASVDAFKSRDLGPVGRVTEDRVRIFAQPISRSVPRFDIDKIIDRPRVPMLTAYGGWEPEFVVAASAGADGLIVEAFGGGHVPSSTVGVLEELATRMPVVISSRTGAGELYDSTYGFPGSETDLRSRGLLFSGDLGGLKSRLLLMTLLATETSQFEIAEVFAGQ